ncbi:hypothetical protein [Metamycoplasma hyosynoviae]|uniref:hypothetical protein n=2 Tax=Metamycoplasma hyosynoviae TaxID=29559 RepID=UPI0020C92D37|nr:hypothetical protein [Metamycoplasma hyosynoviae]UTO26687.1 hypothetical protein NMG94_00400 [Metamycoplasma hyosynoviae]
MNKTTKIILCTAIPVGAASILIPTIVVASLKSKARKTEQDRKLLSDLNLEVEQYLGKITTEIRDANVEQYQELLKLTSKIKNAINNKYLKKEDYRKQLLLLKEKFDNFKEKINPPRKNDTNENTGNTDKENTGDVDSTKEKETPNINKTNENETTKENTVSVYEQLKSKFQEAENFYHSINDSHTELKIKFWKFLDEMKKIADNSELPNQDYENAITSLIENINLYKLETEKLNKEQEEIKQLEEKEKADLDKEYEKVISKIQLFENSLKELENNEHYKDSILKEMLNFKDKFKIKAEEIKKSKIELEQKAVLLYQISDRYKKYKNNIDSNLKLTNEQKNENLKFSITKIKDSLTENSQNFIKFVNDVELKQLLDKFSKEIEKNSKNDFSQMLFNLMNISSIVDLSVATQTNLENIKKLTQSINQDQFLYQESSEYQTRINNIIQMATSKINEIKSAKDIKEWNNEKYLKYLEIFSEIIARTINERNEFNNLVKLFENIKKFDDIEHKLIEIYSNNDTIISNNKKIEINKKVRNYISDYVSSFNKINVLEKTISKINEEIKNIGGKGNTNNTSYIVELENLKNDLLEKMKKHEDIYNINVMENTFNEYKKQYEEVKKDQQQNSHLISKLENFFFSYKLITKDMDKKIDQYKSLLNQIENLSKKYNNDKYSIFIKKIKDYTDEVKKEKFSSMQDINKVNIILESFVKGIKEGVKIIDSLNKNDNSSSEFNKIVEEFRKILKSKSTKVPEIIKNNCKKLIEKIINNNNTSMDQNEINNYVYLINEYKNVFNIYNSITNENKIYDTFAETNDKEYLYELTNEYSFYAEGILNTIELKNINFEFDDIIKLKISSAYIEYLIKLSKEYKEKIDEYENTFKDYKNKFTKITKDIKTLAPSQNSIFANSALFFAKYLIDFAYKYIDDIFIQNINDIKGMTRLIDKLIDTFNKNKELTQ